MVSGRLEQNHADKLTDLYTFMHNFHDAKIDGFTVTDTGVGGALNSMTTAM